MILSDRSIRDALAAGRIIIEPLDDRAIQPSSVDLHVDHFFRVFRNDTTPFIDPKESQEDLTELVEVPESKPFILHPGEFVLGSTLERVALPNDLVARLEGKSSLGRLGLLIHSSLPASETVMVLVEGKLEPRPIGEVVQKRLPGRVVAFDPETFEVGYHEITGWYEGPPDRIFEVVLASGRRVRVTGGHNLFSLDRRGHLLKLRTRELRPGVRLAVPRSIPDPPRVPARIDLLDLVPESEYGRLVYAGPSVAAAFESWPRVIAGMLKGIGIKHADYYRSRSRLPLSVARQLPDVLAAPLNAEDRLTVRGSLRGLPPKIEVDEAIAWLLGLYVAEGSRRSIQFTISNTDQRILDRVIDILGRFDLPLYRGPGAVTCCSSLASAMLGWLGTGGLAPTKRVPPVVFGWPSHLVEAFLEGLVDGDGSREDFRTSVWTCSHGLAGDVLMLAARLGRRAGTSHRSRSKSGLYQIYMPTREHDRLVDGDLMWDTVVDVRDTGEVEPVFDLEVKPDGRRVENFLAGHGGVFVSNTAGFVDAGWDGHLTLELSNVANLPIAIYPGMKIGQISFLQMTTAAEHPYGSDAAGSKYQGQRGPTPSRYYLNFRDDD